MAEVVCALGNRGVMFSARTHDPKMRALLSEFNAAKLSKDFAEFGCLQCGILTSRSQFEAIYSSSVLFM